MCTKSIYFISFILVLSIVAPSMGADPDPSLMGWWTFDGHALDSSGNDRHGTINGDPQFTTGVFNEALEFDGDDYVSIDGYKGVLGTSALSIAAWINKTAGGGQQIVSWGQLANGTRIHFMVRDDSQLRLSTFDGRVESNVYLSLNEWYHVAVAKVQDQTQATLYVDGQDVTSTAQSINSLNIVADVDVGIGWNAPAPGGYFIGIIDEVLIYDKELTPEEIQQIISGAGSEPYPFASSPEPADGTLLEATWVNLRWSPGALAVSHNVYLGESFDDVNDGAEGTFRVNQAATSFIIGFSGFPYPDGLVPGTTYYWRIDEVNDADPNSPWKGKIWSFSIPPRTAYKFDPADGTKYIDPNVTLSWKAGLNAKLHHVYFGDNFDDVNSALVGLPQTDTTYTPGTLEMDKVYYWRVDEFDGAATHKGDVLSFRTMPVIDITDPTLIGWWKFDAGVGTIAPDWSGHGNHGLIANPNWLSPGWIGQSALNFGADSYMAIRNLVLNDANGTEVSISAWIRTSESAMQTIASFDRSDYWRFEVGDSPYAGPGLLGWEVSTSTGVVDLASQKRVDDGQWHHVAGVFDNGTMTIYIDGTPDGSAVGGNTFGIGSTRYGFVGSQSEATVFDGDRSGSPGYWLGSMDDVRIYDRALNQDDIAQVMRGDPLLAWGHQPPSGVYDIEAVPSSLTWRPGDMAAQHDVYFGKDEQAVQSADTANTSGIYRGRQAGTTYVPSEPFEWGQNYYWRIDEFNTDGTISRGGVRAIMVADFRLIDGFESYTDNDVAGEAIWQTWLDGYGIPTNGAQVGNLFPPYAEQVIVHGDSQSMPLLYNNTAGVTNSEASLTLIAPRDWTKYGVGELSLWFRGYPPSVGGFTEGPAGTYTMTGSGADIAGTADEFHFAYKMLTGTGSIIAKIESVENTNSLAKAGVMIRETLDPNSKNAFVCITADSGVISQGRIDAGGASYSATQSGIAAPYWVKLERDVAGNFTAYQSTNGSTWVMVENSTPQNILMNSNTYIGLAVTSHNAAVACEAKFSNVQITGAVGQQWAHQDIGIVGNNAEPMYVALSNSTGTPAVIYHDDTNAATIDTWTEWTIDLKAFADQGLDLTNVDKISLGLGSKGNVMAPGGSGTMYFDDIRLYRPVPTP